MRCSPSSSSTGTNGTGLELTRCGFIGCIDLIGYSQPVRVVPPPASFFRQRTNLGTLAAASRDYSNLLRQFLTRDSNVVHKHCSNLSVRFLEPTNADERVCWASRAIQNRGDAVLIYCCACSRRPRPCALCIWRNRRRTYPAC